MKICGITNPEDAEIAIASGADALGFIFYQKSPRYVNPEAARRIIRTLPAYVTPVGVFVNETRKTIETIISTTGIRIVQLSGDEEPEDCTGLPVKVWKAFRINKIEAVSDIRRYHISAAMLDGARAGLYGGSGVQVDFTIAKAMKVHHPLVLAGGLTAENVLEAMTAVQPYAVDINSGVESSPGKKDHQKIAALFARIAAHYSMNT